ncbi:hypothetical protein ES707_17773 [subsurface metagenome]
MLQYLLYFVIGGAVVASVAYLGSRGNTFLAAFVANLPVLFLLNVFLMYRVSGVDGSLTYAKCVILLLPIFACYAALTVWLLPHLGMTKALLPGLPLYLMPIVVRKIVNHRASKKLLNLGGKPNA